MKKGSHRNRLAVLTSGGDAPGMNACLRAVVRTGIFYGSEVLGIRNGYEGLIQNQLSVMNVGSVGNIIQRGGTLLGTSRSKEFRSIAGRKKAYEVLKAWRVNQLIVLGGDGTLTGAGFLSKEHPIKVVGIPCTIDNDLYGSDMAIGFDTAINTAVTCIDKIRDTADSHGRVFVIEVMGRNTGHLALETALAVGAEFVVVPEIKLKPKSLIQKIQAGIERGKTGSIIIVAEGDESGKGMVLAALIRKHIKRDVRAAILGHLQRGGSPTSKDRNLASELGVAAVEVALAGKNRVMVGLMNGRVVTNSFSKVIHARHRVNLERFRLVDMLSI